MLSASAICLLISKAAHATSVNVRVTIGVRVRSLTWPIHDGASRSCTNISARREGTIKVPFSDVVIAMIAPKVTKLAVPQGRETEATADMGALLDCNCAPGNTP